MADHIPSRAEREAAVEAVAARLTDAQVDAAIVVDGNADPALARLLAEGWTWSDLPHEYVGGKRIRYLNAPPATGGTEEAQS
jgi:hypothetical protein